jgi:hypothetical protein
MKTPEKENVEAELDELDGDCCFCPLDPILWWFALFTVIAGAVALAGMLINVIYIAKHSDLDPRSILLRVYAAVFCGGIVMIEIDWRFIVSRLRIMDLWLVRGAFYGYVGLITCSRDFFRGSRGLLQRLSGTSRGSRRLLQRHSWTLLEAPGDFFRDSRGTS